MGSIRKYEGKRGVSWVIDYVSPDGKRVRQSFKTRKQAQAELTARDYTIQQGTYAAYVYQGCRMGHGAPESF